MEGMIPIMMIGDTDKIGGILANIALAVVAVVAVVAIVSPLLLLSLFLVLFDYSSMPIVG